MVASEGILPLLGVAVVTAAVFYFEGIRYASLPFALFVAMVFVFRDPIRVIPAAPLAVVSPVDGTITDVSTSDSGPLQGKTHCIRIRVNSFGAYTARCPVEGKVMELHRLAGPDNAEPVSAGGLWIRTDENEDVVLQFRGNRFGIPPRAFLQYGERVGQGERCAWLRLTRVAEVQLPGYGRVLVEPGARVSAGSTMLARLHHH